MIIDAAGNVFFGIRETAGGLSLGIPNNVGTLSGNAGRIFGFLNGLPLTIGVVPAILDVAAQSGIAAAASTGDVLVETSDPGQPLTLAANITGGGRVLLDTAGAFAQQGAVSVTAPLFAVDTTGDGVATVSDAVTALGPDAAAITGLPPAAKANSLQFADLSAPASIVRLGSVCGKDSRACAKRASSA